MKQSPFKMLLCTTLLILSSAALVFAQETADVRIDRFENSVVESRRKLSCGQFEAVVSYQSHSTPERPYSLKYRVWFDGDRIRIDRLRGKDKWDKLVVAGDRFYWHLDDSSVAAEMGERRYCKMASSDTFDPRILGLFPHQFEGLHTEKLEYFEQPQRSEATLKPADGDDPDTLVAKYRAGDVVLTKQFTSSSDNAVVQVRYEWESVAKTIVDSVRSEYKSGAAYPNKVIYERWLNSRKACTETITLEDLSLGEPIPHSMFSFEGMNVPADTLVIELPRNSKKVTAVWDGKKLTYPEKVPNQAANDSSRSSGYWTLAVLCAAVALSSVYLLVRNGLAGEKTKVLAVR